MVHAGFGDLLPEVADLGKGEALELRRRSRRCSLKTSSMSCGWSWRVTAREVADDLPVVHGALRRLDGLVEALQASGDVDHRPALLGEAGPGEDDVAGGGGRVGEDVVRDEVSSFSRSSLVKPASADEVLVEDEESLDAIRCGRLRGWRRALRGVVATPEELGAGGVGIAVGRDELAVALAGAGTMGAGRCRGSRRASLRRKSSSLVCRPDPMIATSPDWWPEEAFSGLLDGLGQSASFVRVVLALLGHGR